MITNKIIPAYIIRLFLWEVLSLNEALSKIDTPNGQLIPILPVEDEPRVADSKKAYIIYGYAESEAQRIEQERRGIFSARIWAPTFAQLVEITNLIASTFESSDFATEAVNRYSSNYAGGALVGIRFTHLKTTYIEGGEAAETEGGPVDGVVNISYNYVRSDKNASGLPLIRIPDTAKGGMWS